MKPERKLPSAGRSCPPGALERVVPGCPSCLQKTIVGNCHNGLKDSKMKKHKCNLDLLWFHVNEAKEELESLLRDIRCAQGEKPEGDDMCLLPPQGFTEEHLAGSLSHAYHHLNFAWNGRNKTMLEADSHFSRNEKFPRHFVRYWPRTAQNKRQKSSQGLW